MRKTLGWLPCHACYYVGHFAWLIIDRHPDANIDGEPRWHFNVLMWLYNLGLGWSYEINEWAGLSVWKAAPDDNTANSPAARTDE